MVVDSSGLSCLIPVTVTPIPDPSNSKFTKYQNDVLKNNTIEGMQISNKNISVSETVQNYTDSSCQTDSELYGNENGNGEGNGYCQDVAENDVQVEGGRDGKTAACLDENKNDDKFFYEKQTMISKNENENENVKERKKKNGEEDKFEIVNEERNETVQNVKEEISFECQQYVTPPYSPSSLFIVPSYPITRHNDDKYAVSLSDIRHLVSLSPFLSPKIVSTHDMNENNEIIIGQNNDISDDKNSKEKSYDTNDNNDNDRRSNNGNNSNHNDNYNNNATTSDDSNHKINVTPRAIENQHKSQNTFEEIFSSPPSSSDYYTKKKLYSKNKTSTSSVTYRKNLYGPYSINNLLSNKPVMSMSSSFWKKRLTFGRQSLYYENNF